MDARGELEAPRGNPYVGPRPYTRDEKKLFFGRDREGRDLLSLVISERLVLFYAQSGAGKTSLINTRLVPGLETRNFEVLPVGRVSGELLPGQKVENIFVTNLMINLDMGEDDPSRFRGLRLAEFLLRLTSDGKGFYYQLPAEAAEVEMPSSEDEIEVLPRALIIDQFEELFTTHPEAWKLRKDFILQLVEAMEADPYLWVVLAMREDHIAELDPYVSLLPDGLRARYYMQRMGAEAAFDAVTKPVERLRPFGNQAAHMLVNNLSRISAGKDEEGKTRFVEGEFIEPVQLQVVCYQLWEDLKDQPGEQITLEDLQRLARGQDLAEFINRALADFYQDTLKKALRQPRSKVRETKLREWFSTRLITEANTRGFVYMGEHSTAGIPNAVVLYLEGKLLRGESRAGGRWYELVHDRFIEPILQSNSQWVQARQRKLLLVTGRSVLGILLISLILYIVLGVLGVNIYQRAQTRALEATSTAAFEAAGTAAATANEAKSIANEATSIANAATSTANDAIRTAAAVTRTLLSARQAAATEERANFNALQQTAKVTEAAAVEATRSALEAQLHTPTPSPKPPGSQPTPIGTPGGSPVAATPTLTSNKLTPTPPEIGNTPVELSDLATATALQAELHNLIATQTAQAQPVREQVIGYTSRKTPIKITQIGTGPRNVVLVGGLTGRYALSSSELTEWLRKYFQDNIDQIPEDVTLHIVSNANPDSENAPGTISGRLNDNGIDLNRNWGCNWKRDTTFSNYPVSGGSEAFSELETQALRDYLLLTHPEAVIIWDASYLNYGTISPGGCGDMSLFSGWLASLYGKKTNYISGEIPSRDTGDAANWLDSKEIPAIRVKLPYIKSEFLRKLDLEAQRDYNLQAVLAIIEQVSR